MLTTLVGFVVQKLKRTSRMFSKISEALNTSLKNTFSRSSTKRVTKHTVWASDCIFCVKTVRSVSTVFSSLATWEEVCNKNTNLEVNTNKELFKYPKNNYINKDLVFYSWLVSAFQTGLDCGENSTNGKSRTLTACIIGDYLRTHFYKLRNKSGTSCFVIRLTSNQITSWSPNLVVKRQQFFSAFNCKESLRRWIGTRNN